VLLIFNYFYIFKHHPKIGKGKSAKNAFTAAVVFKVGYLDFPKCFEKILFN